MPPRGAPVSPDATPATTLASDDLTHLRDAPNKQRGCLNGTNSFVQRSRDPIKASCATEMPNPIVIAFGEPRA